MNSKRNDCLEWQEYFMSVALLAAQCSKDPSTQVGACIVNKDHNIVGTGYNGMPKGCSDDDFPWCRKSFNKHDNKQLYVCHAEMNAILNKNSADVRGCTIYVGLFPCNECAKIIIQSGISEVIYLSDKHAHKNKYIAAKKMFDAVGIKYTQYIPTKEKIEIYFTENTRDDQSEQRLPTPPKLVKLDDSDS